MNSDNGNAGEAELMFEILNFARTKERRILKQQLRTFGKDADSIVEKLVMREYLKKVDKEGQEFHSITNKGLNLFGDRRKRNATIPDELKSEILEKLQDIIGELRIKPWELMFHIVCAVGINQPVTTEEISDYLQKNFPEEKGLSRANIYRYLQRLRMKGYIEYKKTVYQEQSPYMLSEKGREIFGMAKDEATHKLRTSEEWDACLKRVYEIQDEREKQDNEALFHSLRDGPPDLDKKVMAWVLFTRANVLELKGNLQDAEKEYLHMESLCEEAGDTRGRAYALKGLGTTAFKLGRYGAAEEYYNKCYRIAQHVGDTLLLSDLSNDMGACLYMNDEVDEALKAFEKALTLAGSDESRHASALYNCGLCYARKEDYAKARELWEESLRVYQGLEHTPDIQKVEHNLREIDRKEKHEYLENGLRKAREFGTTEEIKKAYKELVEFLLESSQTTQGG
ncbi:MAG: tetratricopeptide repeat protein [Theionarchaea archaeon]|nr:tetratricopeptide repeat protein [Theionarchaea archaeon]